MEGPQAPARNTAQSGHPVPCRTVEPVLAMLTWHKASLQRSILLEGCVCTSVHKQAFFICIHVYLLIYLPTNPPTHPPTYLHTYIQTDKQTNKHGYVRIFLCTMVHIHAPDTCTRRVRSALRGPRNGPALSRLEVLPDL